MEDHNGSSYLHEEQCECGGSGGKRYSDGHFYCFSCKKYEHGDDQPQTERRHTRVSGDLIALGEYKALAKRGITEETCRKFSYTVGKYKGQTVQITPFYDADRNMVAQQLRFPNKDFVILGSLKTALLDGQQLWERGGRRVVVTEGSIDKMSVSQLQGNKWPVVSIPNGVDSAKRSIAAQLEWLCSFEEVVLMFDNDEPGARAVAEVAPMFPPGKCKVASLPLKDANDMLQAGRGAEVVTAIWNAKSYRPDGIVTLSDIREKMLAPKTYGLSWFLPKLTELTYGRHWCHIYAFGAGTGVGKTDFLTQQMMHDMTVLNERIGVFSLEQPPEETGERIAGKFAGKCFHLPGEGWTQEEKVEAIDALEKGGKLFLYDSFGATDWDVIKGHIRFLNHSEEVRIFYLDHLTALAAAEDDERKGLERIMSEMAALAKELRIIIHLVSHLSSPDGTPHEEGGRVMVKHFKGSRAIGFWCHAMYGLERNQQAEDPEEQKITTFRILKDRKAGRATGKTIALAYNVSAGQLYEYEPEYGFNDTTQADGQPADF